MLESIQQSLQKSKLVKFLLFVIIIFFIFAGYFTSTLFGGNPDQIAEVEGSAITNSQVQQRMDNLRAQMGERFDQQYATEASKELLRAQILEQLINEQVLQSNIKKAGLTASDEQIKEWTRNYEAFQINGEYDAATAKLLLSQNGWSEQRFKAFAADQIIRQQLTDGVTSSGFSLDKEVEALYRLQEQTRDVRVLRVPKAKFAEAAEISEEAINDYYQQNQAEFEQAEKVNLSFVRLSVAELTEANEATITEQQVTDYYEQNKSNYQTTPEIQVAHILIDNSVDNAQDKANELFEQIQAGADFAELAKKESSDTFSGENGGVLDWVDAVAASDAEDGTGWAPEFEAAALALQNIGDVSDVVETDFGFHIIKLVEKRAGETSPLADVSEAIKTTLAQQAAESTFYEKQTQLNETLFEFGDDINAFAKQVGLAVQETGLFDEANPVSIATNSVVMEQAFSSAVLNSTEVSDMIDLGGNDIVYLTKKDYQAAKVKELAEVRESIVAKLREEKAVADTKAFADKVLAAIEAEEDTEALLTDKELAWVENSALKSRDSAMDFDLISAVFQQTAPQTEEAVRTTEALFNGDYAVIELKGVSYPDATAIDDATKQQLKQRLNYANSQSDLNNLLQDFRAQSDIEK